MLPLLKRSVRSRKSIASLSKRSLSIHEHQAQGLLAECGVPVPKGRLARDPSEVRQAIESLGGRGVVKAQCLAGGRGKGLFKNGHKSGVHVVSS